MSDTTAASIPVPPPLTSMLNDAQVAAFVSGYAAAPAALANYAETVVNGLHPSGAAVFDAFVDHFNTTGDDDEPTSALGARERECVIISLLCAGNVQSALVIHLYWGLCVGLTIAELADLLLLAGGYSGTQNYTNGLGTLAGMLGKLAALVPGDGPYAPVDPIAGYTAIRI